MKASLSNFWKRSTNKKNKSSSKRTEDSQISLTKRSKEPIILEVSMSKKFKNYEQKIMN